ncbi:MAG: hypothetical protein HDR26_04085, partial [Lachnospiraceae bacterium]|nr:hypothetical protein [Lachnospiraceae bacterium]
MQLKDLANLTDTLQILNKSVNIADTFNTLSLSMQKAVLASGQLSAEQLKLIATSNIFSKSANGNKVAVSGLTLKEVKNAASNALVAESQAGTTATTLGLGAAFKGLRISIKNATIAMGKFLFTTPAGWATLAVSAFAIAAIAVVNYNKQIEENKKKIREAAEEAKNVVQTIKSNFDTLVSDTDRVKDRYAELAQEAENLGKANQSRGKLSVEDYNEFLDLSNQLAKLFPQLTKGYDDNGNAILDLSGNVDTIVGSLDDLVSVQHKLANQEIMKNMPDVWAGYMLDLNEFNKELKSSEKIVDQHLEWANALRNRSTITLGDEYYNDLLIDAAEAAGIMNSRYGNDFYKEKKIAADAGPSFISASWDFSKLSDDEYEKLLGKLGEFGSNYEDTVQIVKGNIASANSGLASYINTWLSTEWNYNKLDSDMQNAVKSMLFDGDWVNSIPATVDSGNWDEVSNWLQQEILYEINKVQDNEEISKALSEVFANTELTPEAKVDYVRQIQDYFGEGNEITVLLQPQLEETETLNNQYQDAISRFGKESQDKLEKFFKDYSINDFS